MALVKYGNFIYHLSAKILFYMPDLVYIHALNTLTVIQNLNKPHQVTAEVAYTEESRPVF